MGEFRRHRADDEIQDALDGRLPAAGQMEFEGHLAGCEDCHGLTPVSWDLLPSARKLAVFLAVCFKRGPAGVPQPCFCIQHHVTQFGGPRSAAAGISS